MEARRAHNPKVVGSNPTPATNIMNGNRDAPLLAQAYHWGHLTKSAFSGMANCLIVRLLDKTTQLLKVSIAITVRR